MDTPKISASKKSDVDEVLARVMAGTDALEEKLAAAHSGRDSFIPAGITSVIDRAIGSSARVGRPLVASLNQ